MLSPSAENLKTYMLTGGFPEYVKTGDEEQLSTLFDDILIRDIVTRYGIKDIKSLHRLASYLVANIGNRITATKLKQPLSIAATSTVLKLVFAFGTFLPGIFFTYVQPFYQSTTH
jgi:predicted AAA+ superfamily ATPase